MNDIKKILSAQENLQTSGYINIYSKLIKLEPPENSKTIKIAVLTSFTTNGLKEVLYTKCIQQNIWPEIYIGQYKQYVQEILNDNSKLYHFSPEFTIFFVDSRSLIGDLFYFPHKISDKERQELAYQKLEEINDLILKIKNNTSSKILIHNFEVPYHSYLGILENKQDFGFIEFFEYINYQLKKTYKKDNRVFIFDYNAFCSNIGKKNILDYKLYCLADMKLNFETIPLMCDEYLAYIKSIKSIIRKCLVLDLDNTLWGGIIGEDGLEGIKLGPTPEGRPFWEFQAYILSLYNKGIILAVNSKNNREDALQVLRDHPHMLLREEHFAALEINWNDKISNMHSIAEQLNVGMDSLVFIDDDKLNRKMIRESLPEVLVLDLPEDPSLYLESIMNLKEFNTLQITDEDKNKGKMYAEQRKRNEFKKSLKTTDITKFLADLDMKVTIEKANDFNMPRISQLTQKTNQFNLTTKRYLEDEIREFTENKDYLVLCMSVEDKFGDSGITGVAIIEKGDNWKIDSFLLSCRVMGRKVENALLHFIFSEAKKNSVKFVLGELIYTKKNMPSRDFYKENGFNLISKDINSELWKYDLSEEYFPPEFMKIVYK